MSTTEPAPLRPPTMGGPLIPTPPPARGKPRKRMVDPQWLIWLGALALGIALGVAAYQLIPGVDTAFESWVALLS